MFMKSEMVCSIFIEQTFETGRHSTQTHPTSVHSTLLNTFSFSFRRFCTVFVHFRLFVCSFRRFSFWKIICLFFGPKNQSNNISCIYFFFCSWHQSHHTNKQNTHITGPDLCLIWLHDISMVAWEFSYTQKHTNTHIEYDGLVINMVHFCIGIRVTFRRHVTSTIHISSASSTKQCVNKEYNRNSE